jgi:hypothetical protein
MTLYHLVVHLHDDPEGTELLRRCGGPRSGPAGHRDLKKNNEAKWIGWTMEVTDGDREVWQIPFAGTE